VILLGIDPGTAALGYGVIERTGTHLRPIDHGCFVTSPDSALPERLRAIHEHVADLIELHRPDVVAVERLFFSRNVQTAFAVGQARGVVLLAAAQAAVPVGEATPSEIKTAVAGDGRADKEQIGRMVKLVLGMAAVPTPDDAADALAVAIWAANVSSGLASQTATVLDRAAVAPITRGDRPYDRAVREALSRDRAARRTAS
jgi:crossover junction endodeoxyribonuclease RuvC